MFKKGDMKRVEDGIRSYILQAIGFSMRHITNEDVRV